MSLYLKTPCTRWPAWKPFPSHLRDKWARARRSRTRRGRRRAWGAGAGRRRTTWWTRARSTGSRRCRGWHWPDKSGNGRAGAEQSDNKGWALILFFNSRDPEPGSGSRRFDKTNILIQHAVIMSFVDIWSFVILFYPIHLTMANEGATTCLWEAYQ